MRTYALGLLLLLPGSALLAAEPPEKLAPYFQPPKELAGQLGDYRSPLRFDDGSPVKTAEDWNRRRQEIRNYWMKAMGEWPKLLDNPKVVLGEKTTREGVTQIKIKIEITPTHSTDDAILFLPEGKGPFPAVLTVFYEAQSAAGLNPKAPTLDYALQLAKRGFVTLSLGSPPVSYYPNQKECRLQPLSYHAYVAANCCTALAKMPQVDPKRIGVLGHSYGGKWALFAAALHDGFACMATSDPGIVFDEKRSNVNYWEPWYLGFDPELKEQRKPGVVTEANGRTGPYKKFVAEGRDLHELHALLAPRPFFVSAGSEDPPERWKALNHSVAVNKFLGVENRVAMTNRKLHRPDPADNEILYLFFEYALKK